MPRNVAFCSQKFTHRYAKKQFKMSAKCVCGRQMRVDRVEPYRGLGRNTAAVLSQGKEEENCINYPNTNDTVPTYKRLNSEFSRLTYTALSLNHLRRAIWTCILPWQISSQ